MQHAFRIASAVLAIAVSQSPAAELVDVRRIADDAPHSAFTDLVRWRDQFVCAFRQGRGHVSTDGRICVLASPDGDKWEKAAQLALEGYDLRDASLSETPDGRLMLLGGAAPRKADDESAPTGTFVAFSDDGRAWTKPEIIVEPGRWLWRVTWHDGKAYGIAYAAGSGDADRSAALMASADGRKFDVLVPKIDVPGFPTEAVIRFAADGTALCLQRRDGAPEENSAYLGVAHAPYTEWEWHDLGAYFGGPNLIVDGEGHWLAAGRLLTAEGPKTVLASLDVDKPKLTPLVTLPSGGDTSYPGLAWHNGQLLVSFYSSHKGKTMIYLARIRL